MNITFSILISCYINDDPNELNKSLNSIANQTISPQQIVLVCDGPLEESQYRVINNFEKKAIDLNIKTDIIKLDKNYGLGSALAKGSLYCIGSHIVRMDSDDICDHKRLEMLQTELIDNSSIDILGSYIEEFQDEIGDLKRIRKVPLTHKKILYRSKFMNPMNHVTACIRREVLQTHGNYEHMLWHEDYFLWLKLIKNGANFKNLDQIHVYVRVDGLAERRKGLKYFNAEISFAFEALRRGYFNFINVLQFILPRTIVRFSPNFFVNYIYSLLRFKHEKK